MRTFVVRWGVRALRASLASGLLVGVAACADEAEVRAPLRSALVERPVDAAASTEAYAGEIRARRESPLSFRVGGNLLERRVEVGDRVRAGQVLAVLDPQDLQAQARAAQAQLAAADAELARARADQSRFATLESQRLVSRSTLDAQTAALKAAQGQADAARAQLAVARNQAGYAQLRAPRDGVIARRDVEAGQVVGAGQTVFVLAADGGREAVFAVPEGDAIEVGAQVLVERWSRPGQRWPARVREVSPAADPASRTFAARAEIDAPADALALGESARIYRSAGGDAALSVPLSALQQAPQGAAVYVFDPATRTVRRVPVRTGAFGEARVPVTSGLRAQDWVVVAGGHLLREGQEVVAVDRQNRPVAPPAAAATPER